ncbi:MAG: endonuclease III domain-containing protein [Planctomycetota bacterium]
MKRTKNARGLMDILERLFAAYGPRDWWPAKTKTEVVVGAILTQNTAWKNVERAIRSLREAHCLHWKALRDVSEEELARLIRSSGTFRVKAKRLKAFVDVLWKDHGGSLPAMLDGEVEEARARLLKISGVGPETADAILLYAGDRPTFVVDAYTRRILRRHFFIDDRADYDEVRGLFHSELPRDVNLFNEYHALLVEVGKRHCRTKADCGGCPLAALRHEGER